MPWAGFALSCHCFCNDFIAKAGLHAFFLFLYFLPFHVACGILVP